jgi:hypothetical protein
MSAGEFVILACLLLGLGNFWWSYANWKAHKVNLDEMKLSQEIREHALQDAALIQSNKFRVCETCGRIVQGFCGTCAISACSPAKTGDS